MTRWKRDGCAPLPGRMFYEPLAVVGPDADAVETGPAPLEVDPVAPEALAAPAIGAPLVALSELEPVPIGGLFGLEALMPVSWLDAVEVGGAGTLRGGGAGWGGRRAGADR